MRTGEFVALVSYAAILMDEVARSGSIRRAAGRMNASPSAVNRQILNLEAELGVALFERLPSGMRPTAAGEAILVEVRQWRRAQSRVRTHLQELKGLRRGHITVGMMECFGRDIGPRVFRDIIRQQPRITLQAIVGGTDAIADQLSTGHLDVAVAFSLPARPGIKTIYAISVPVAVAVAPGHPLGKRKWMSLGDCVGYPIVMPDSSLAFRDLIENALAQSRETLLASVTANSIEFIKGSLQDQHHISLLTWLDVYREVASKALRFIPLRPAEMLHQQLFIGVPARKKYSSLAMLVAGHLQAEIEDVVRNAIRAPNDAK
jgi:DNA-binding transcriptional LysR family regulator